MRLALPIAAVLVLLAGCLPGSGSQPSLHDVYLYGTLDARLSYLYGGPGSLTVDGQQVTLTQGSMDAPYAVANALLVNGRPYLRSAVAPLPEPPVEVARIPQTTDLVIHAHADLQHVVYYDGSAFFDLVDAIAAGVDKRVVPVPRLNRLRGLGQLTDAEADALAATLTRDGGAFALAVLPPASLPAHAVDGVADQRTTGLYVQGTLATDASAFTPAPQRLAWEVLAQGDQAVGVQDQTFVLVNDAGQLANLWNQAQGARLELPPIPQVDFGRETVLAIFMGQQPTGGYGVDVRRVSIDNGDLYVDVAFTKPAGGAITTQQVTSPWTMIHVLRGGFTAAWFRDADSGELLGVARAPAP